MAWSQARLGSPVTGVALLVALAAGMAPRPATAASGPAWCLPPIFEGGQRLHELPSPTAYWLPPLLRQHQLCHQARAQPDTPRAILIGSSAVFGLPLPVEETLSGRLNQRLAERDAPGSVFNLAWVNPYQLRDAFILRAALAYQPDLIIYAVTLAEFIHSAPALFPSLAAFFRSNGDMVRALADAPLPGLEEPLKRYKLWGARSGRANEAWSQLRDTGALVRAAAHESAEGLARRADGTLPPSTFPTRGRQTDYDCGQTLARDRRDYADWQSWNVLAYLQALHDSSGIPVLVVNWPVAHEPVGECYNVRYSAARIDEFNTWLVAETRARRLGYVDLHDLLPPDLFFDSMHPTAEGHLRIADRLAPAVETVLRTRAAAHAPRPQE